jgi:hypothetical protein
MVILRFVTGLSGRPRRRDRSAQERVAIEERGEDRRPALRVDGHEQTKTLCARDQGPAERQAGRKVKRGRPNEDRRPSVLW